MVARVGRSRSTILECKRTPTDRLRTYDPVKFEPENVLNQSTVNLHEHFELTAPLI